MKTAVVLEALMAALPTGRKRTDGDAVFNAMTDRVAGLRSDPTRWELFVEMLVAAESEDLIVLPSKNGDGWNDTVFPARPKWVALPPIRTIEDRFDHRSHPWSPHLAFLAAQRILPKGIRTAALEIQNYLAAGGMARPLVPIKERSLDIFGDEKRLEGLQHSQILFGPDKVTLQLLRCFVVAPTPVTERFMGGRGILITENEATFDSFCRVARHVPTWGLVVYGRGNEIQKCTAYLKNEVKRTGLAEIHYFGDVDRRGMEIPRQLAATGLHVVPFIAGYEALLVNTLAADRVPDYCAWLPSPWSARAAAVILSGARIPQEAFGWDELAAIHGLNPHVL